MELFLANPVGAAVERALRGETAAVPGHFEAECYAAVRRAVRRGLASAGAVDAAVVQMARFGATRVTLDRLLPAAHALGHRLSAGDAFYVALARALDADLVTCDVALSRAASGLARVRLIAPPRSAVP